MKNTVLIFSLFKVQTFEVNPSTGKILFKPTIIIRPTVFKVVISGTVFGL